MQDRSVNVIVVTLLITAVIGMAVVLRIEVTLPPVGALDQTPRLLAVHSLAIERAAKAVELSNQSRVALAQLLGGVAVAIGLLLTSRQLFLQRESQITTALASAITSLASKTVSRRVAAVLTISRAARISVVDREMCAQVLCAFVRDQRPWLPGKPSACIDLSVDVQHALKEMAYLNGLLSRNDGIGLSLRDVDLRGAMLSGLNFERVDLRGAHLEESDCRCTIFRSALLDAVHLENAYLSGCDVRNARLERTFLAYDPEKEERCWGIDVRGSDLSSCSGVDANFVHHAQADNMTKWPNKPRISPTAGISA